MHLNDLLFLLPKISFFPNLHPEMFPEYVFERGFTNSASFFTENRGASFSQFPLTLINQPGPPCHDVLSLRHILGLSKILTTHL